MKKKMDAGNAEKKKIQEKAARRSAWIGPVYLFCIVGFVLCGGGLMIVDAMLIGHHYYGDIWNFLFPSSHMGSFVGSFWPTYENHATWMFALRNQVAFFLWLAIAGGLMMIAALVYLCVAIRGKDENGDVIVKQVDRIYSEIQLGIIVALVACGVVFAQAAYRAVCSLLSAGNGIFRMSSELYTHGPALISLVFCLIIATLIAAIGLWMILSCVRKMKARRFLKQSILGKIGKALAVAFYEGGSVTRKVVLVAVLICLLSATIFLAPIVLAVIIVLAPRWVKQYEAIKKGVEEVRSGNLTYQIPVLGTGELDQLAGGINEISEASNIAVQNELKNQRLKTELISNVSHDLRTPLTSMVTYIDLLKTEGVSSENAPEYLKVLDQKTQRLRQLTDDLFDAAKASSGATAVRKEKVDVLSLINQGLGEMDQSIRDSGLQFIVNAPEEKYVVWADGQLLWRVVENLLSNVLKYAQENTRVYIDLAVQGSPEKASGMVLLAVKNISKQALNIHADDLLERFKRGDESRSTEGSGLGLTIAKDLVKLQGGWLEIKIDGDLFKATVLLEKAEPDAEATEQA